MMALLEGYASGRHSFSSLADELNAKGFRTRGSTPFKPGSIKAVLDNRFYEGKVIYHRGLADEDIL